MDKIDAIIATFPKRFGLRACPGQEFEISRGASYEDRGQVYLYTYTQRDGKWVAFAKGTPEELRREVVELRGIICEYPDDPEECVEYNAGRLCDDPACVDCGLARYASENL